MGQNRKVMNYYKSNHVEPKYVTSAEFGGSSYANKSSAKKMESRKDSNLYRQDETRGKGTRYSNV